MSEIDKKNKESPTDKLRTLFGLGNSQKDENGHPQKPRFNLWYAVIAILLFTYLNPFSFLNKWRQSHTVSSSNILPMVN